MNDPARWLISERTPASSSPTSTPALYRYPKEGAEPQIAGYVATNTVRVETSTLDHVGRIIDAAVTSGTNNVQELDFVRRSASRSSGS